MIKQTHYSSPVGQGWNRPEPRCSRASLAQARGSHRGPVAWSPSLLSRLGLARGPAVATLASSRCHVVKIVKIGAAGISSEQRAAFECRHAIKAHTHTHTQRRVTGWFEGLD